MARKTDSVKLVSGRDAVRQAINESRRSIGLDPLTSRQDTPEDHAVAYGRFFRRKRFVEDMNRRIREAGIPGLTTHALPACTNSCGRELFERVWREVVLEGVERGARWNDDETYSRTVRRLFERKGRSEAAPTKRSVKTADLKLTELKFVGSGRRIRGFASTNLVDRMGDVVEPSGMIVNLPVSLLWQHDRNFPVGVVTSAEARGNGIWIEAELATGTPTADQAWELIQARAVDNYSIGFLPLETEPMSNGGWRYKRWELLEVSTVSVAAGRDVRIQRGKQSSAKTNQSQQAVRLVNEANGIPLVNMSSVVRLTR